jgi:hypothetical protein
MVSSTRMDDDGRYAEIQSRVRLRVLHDGVLLSALRWAAQDDGSDREIRTAIQSTCATAREAGVTAEQLLIVLKECWRKLNATRATVSRTTSFDVRHVTLRRGLE